MRRGSFLHPSKVSTKAFGSTLAISGFDWKLEFDLARGYLQRWESDGTVFLEADSWTKAALIPSFWRPPTDNDKPRSVPYWERFALKDMTSQLRNFKFDQNHSGVSIQVHTFLSPPVVDWGWDCRMVYHIDPLGSLNVSTALEPIHFFPEHVPRVGLNVRSSGNLDTVRWNGLGPGESYPDKRCAQRLGIWSSNTVAELQTNYDIPQENGNRMETKWVTFTDPQGFGILATRTHVGPKDEMEAGFDPRFNWAASRYSTDTIEKASHPCDLIEEDAVFIRLDEQVAGVGTGACGPDVRDEDRVKVEQMSFAFKLDRVYR